MQKYIMSHQARLCQKLAFYHGIEFDDSQRYSLMFYHGIEAAPNVYVSFLLLI